MCEMSLKIVRYGLQCSEKLEISKSDEKFQQMKVAPGLAWRGKCSHTSGEHFLRYLGPPSSHIRKIKTSVCLI